MKKAFVKVEIGPIGITKICVNDPIDDLVDSNKFTQITNTLYKDINSGKFYSYEIFEIAPANRTIIVIPDKIKYSCNQGGRLCSFSLMTYNLDQNYWNKNLILISLGNYRIVGIIKCCKCKELFEDKIKTWPFFCCWNCKNQ